MSVNKVILIGRVGKDPEMRPAGNVKLASFSLATSETFKDRNGDKQEVTEWHDLEVWGKLGELVEKYVTKGMQLYIEGKIKTDTWEKDGEKKYRKKIVVLSLTMLRSGERKELKTSNREPRSTQEEQDDLPF